MKIAPPPRQTSLEIVVIADTSYKSRISLTRGVQKLWSYLDIRRIKGLA